MRFSSDDKNIRKMQLKDFHELAGKQLLAKGFKKKNHTYYRIFGDELFQVISFGWLSMRNYELHFSIIPLYGNYIGINVSPTPFDEWASIPISFAIGGTRDFNLQLKYLCDVMINELDGIGNSETLCAYMEKWNEFMYELDKIWNDEDDDTDEEDSADDEEIYIMKKFPFLEDCPFELGTPWFYAALREGLYDDVLKSINYAYYRRVGINEYDFKQGTKTADDCEANINSFKEMFWQEFEIKRLIEQKETASINVLFKRNLEHNYAILTKTLHLDL